ncbi:MAG: class A beta-lactamase-related serine hydrolase [Maledivibacter sp.]|jgi:beta-lactamase class A|nr:class A beta-lactamase-related serine hydrolase [Maledivibacter sp.]
MNSLRSELLSYLETLDGNYALYIKDLKSNSIIKINEEKRFHSASIIKLYYLYEALMQVQDGVLGLDTAFNLSSDEKVGGAGVLHLLHDNIELTLEDLLSLMIDVSDNTATNMLYDILGKDNINTSIKKLGINNTLAARKLMRVIPGVYSYTTARDAAIILENFMSPRVLRKDLAEKALEILGKQQFNDGISKYLTTCGHCGSLIKSKNICRECKTNKGEIDPVKVPFYHKTGEITGVTHDAGILIINNNPIIVVMLINQLKDNLEGKFYMSKVGEIIYNFYSSKEISIKKNM